MQFKLKPQLIYALLIPLGAGACAADTVRRGDEEPVGGIVVALTNVPGDVGCVRLDVTGNTRSETRDFDVSPGASTAELQVRGLPVGLVSVTAFAFGGACAQVTVDSVDAWFSDPVNATVPRGALARVAITMKRNGRGTVSLDFPADEAESGDGPGCAAGAGWRDDFNAATLDPAWRVFEYTDARHNNQTTPANHYSVGSGVLHYVLDPMTEDAYAVDYMPHYDGSFYWYDPGVELSREVTGTHWTLDVRADYFVPAVVNSAGLVTQVVVDDPGAQDIGCAFTRYSNDSTGGSEPDRNVFTASCWSGHDVTDRAPYDPHVVRTLRFTRANDQLAVSVSSDGITFEELARSDTLPAEFRCTPQRLLISGLAWFSPNGSYADYDYVQLTQE